MANTNSDETTVEGVKYEDCGSDLARALEVIDNPRSFDVLLGRGRWYAAHTGNRRLQILVNMHLSAYQESRKRARKTAITNTILSMVKSCGEEPGRFLRRNIGINGWEEVDDEVARIKISQAIRYSMRASQQELIPRSLLHGAPVNLQILCQPVQPVVADPLIVSESSKTQRVPSSFGHNESDPKLS